MQLSRRALLTGIAATLALPTAVWGAPPAITTIHIDNMHCPTCARRIASRLYAVAGVMRVSTDVSKGVAIVTPQSSRQPSPLAMWNAVIKAGFKPTKLEGPQGTFNDQPNV